jgi:hypothetical protein
MMRSGEHDDGSMGDAFEQKLASMPLRQVPAEWRAEMLSLAESARERSRAPAPSRVSNWLASLWRCVTKPSSLLWPSPAAWAGLAVIWLGILALNHAAGDKNPVLAGRLPGSDPGIFLTWKDQERLWTELAPPREVPVAEPARATIPQRRSERRPEFLRA